MPGEPPKASSPYLTLPNFHIQHQQERISLSCTFSWCLACLHNYFGPVPSPVPEGSTNCRRLASESVPFGIIPPPSHPQKFHGNTNGPILPPLQSLSSAAPPPSKIIVHPYIRLSLQLVTASLSVSNLHRIEYTTDCHASPLLTGLAYFGS